MVQDHFVDKYGAEVDKSGPNEGYPAAAHHIAGFRGYYDDATLFHRLQLFIKSLGYQALEAGPLNVAAGVMTGLTEESRTGMAGSPEYGISLRKCTTIITDLSLANTKPIDGGLHNFCRACKICADNCPSGALSVETEQSWDIHEVDGQPINRPGIKAWKQDWQKCIDYGVPIDCGICHATCPFNHIGDSLVHSVAKATAATTSIFNSFFASMDRAFGYAKNLDGEAWWNRDLASWSHDGICGRGTG